MLIFDSGIGGISIYNEIKNKLTNIHYIYLFDNLCFPYGEKTDQFIIYRLIKIFNTIIEKHVLCAIIIACNTASTLALKALRKLYTIPIIGVVPAIKPAVKLTRNGIIGLLATNATISSSYINELISEFAQNYNIKMLSSSKLVHLAESKFSGNKVSLNKIYDIIKPWLIISNQPDTVILGCTHFHFLREELQLILPKTTYLIDSNAAIASRTAFILSNMKEKYDKLQKNIVYCTCLDNKSIKLFKIFKNYGFALSEIISLN
ncbi:MAG: glutamate racemase [Pantoea sp. Brub]|nr:glutamate racemase [Pantoea sp. Brub]